MLEGIDIASLLLPIAEMPHGGRNRKRQEQWASAVA